MPDLDRFQQDIEALLEEPIATYFAWLAMADPDSPVYPLLHQEALVTARETLSGALRLAHQLAGTLGAGGAPMDAWQMERMLDNLAAQQTYLDSFLQDLPTLTEPQARTRAAQYAVPVLQTYSKVAAARLPRLPHEPGDYDLACHGFCKCYLRIVRVGEAAWNVWWVTTALESCPDCIALNRAWNPLRIREGVIVDEQREVG